MGINFFFNSNSKSDNNLNMDIEDSISIDKINNNEINEDKHSKIKRNQNQKKIICQRKI